VRRVAFILLLTLAAPAFGQQTKAGDLVPVEAGTVDVSATQTTLRVMPVELNESTNFMRLYGVAGLPDLLVRSQGGMYAVFDQGQYVSWKGVGLPVWPSGTQFFIGRPDFTNVRAPGIRMDTESTMLPAPGIRAKDAPSPGGQPDARVPDDRHVVRDARVPDARLSSPRVETRLEERRAPDAKPAPPVSEAHAVPPDSKRIEPAAPPAPKP
jgi:hypothetical protein